MNGSAIGVDIGGTNIRVGWVNENLGIARKLTASTDRFDSAEALFSEIGRMVEAVDADREAGSVGIALPVPWRAGLEYIADATNIPCLENVPVGKIPSYFPGYEVICENDVNVIAVLESEHGAAKGCAHSMYITVSTGIASGIVVHNRILHGANGYAGEIGSMIVAEGNDGRASWPGGTLEALCSGKALQDKSRRLYGRDATSHTLFERYHDRDEQAAEVIGLWVDRFSTALASLLHTVDPDIFVMGGAVLDHNPWLIEEVKKGARAKSLEHLRDRIRVARPVFGSDAGVIGAAYTAWKQAGRTERR